MSVMAHILRVAALCACLIFPAKAMAASCWITHGASIAFGTIATDSINQTQASVGYSCQADYGATQYFAVCLSSLEEPPFIMTSNGDEFGRTYSLQFNLYNASDTAQMLATTASGNLIQQTFAIGSNQQTSSTFHLLARMPTGQNSVPAYSYFNYSLGIKITWNTSTQESTLTPCQGGMSSGSAIDDSSNANATISTGCFIESVSTLDFGTVSAESIRSGIHSTATLRTHCPPGTQFSIGLDNGTHASGSTRQLCSASGDCLAYSLWQDSAATQPWGNSRGENTLEATNNNGNVQDYTIFGVVPAQSPPAADTYSDDVIVTLSY